MVATAYRVVSRIDSFVDASWSRKQPPPQLLLLLLLLMHLEFRRQIYFIIYVWAFYEFLFDQNIGVITPWKETLPGITKFDQ